MIQSTQRRRKKNREILSKTLHETVETMYKNPDQTPLFPEFGLPFDGYLDPENRRMKKPSMIPWKLVEEEYKQILDEEANAAELYVTVMAN